MSSKLTNRTPKKNLKHNGLVHPALISRETAGIKYSSRAQAKEFAGGARF